MKKTIKTSLQFDQKIIEIIENSGKFEKHYKNYISSSKSDKKELTKILNTLKIIIKSRKFLNKQKFLALKFLQELINSKKNEKQTKIFFLLKDIFLRRFYEILEKINNSNLEEIASLLNEYSIENSKKWGLRFYLLLTECLKYWSFFTEKRKIFFFEEKNGGNNYDKEKNVFRTVFLKLNAKLPFFEKKYYLDTDLENLEEKDREFLQDCKLPRKKRKTEKSPKKNFLDIFEKIKLSRKLLMHEIFRNRIVSDKIKIQKKDYEKRLITNFEKIEKFLKNKNPIFIKEKKKVLKEMELANKLFKYYDENLQEEIFDTKKIFLLRKKICEILKKIFGGLPKYYEKFLNYESKVFGSRCSLESYKDNKSRNMSKISMKEKIKIKSKKKDFVNSDNNLNLKNKKNFGNEKNLKKSEKYFGDILKEKNENYEYKLNSEKSLKKEKTKKQENRLNSEYRNNIDSSKNSKNFENMLNSANNQNLKNENSSQISNFSNIINLPKKKGNLILGKKFSFKNPNIQKRSKSKTNITRTFSQNPKKRDNRNLSFRNSKILIKKNEDKILEKIIYTKSRYNSGVKNKMGNSNISINFGNSKKRQNSQILKKTGNFENGVNLKKTFNFENKENIEKNIKKNFKESNIINDSKLAEYGIKIKNKNSLLSSQKNSFYSNKKTTIKSKKLNRSITNLKMRNSKLEDEIKRLEKKEKEIEKNIKKKNLRNSKIKNLLKKSHLSVDGKSNLLKQKNSSTFYLKEYKNKHEKLQNLKKKYSFLQKEFKNKVIGSVYGNFIGDKVFFKDLNLKKNTPYM